MAQPKCYKARSTRKIYRKELRRTPAKYEIALNSLLVTVTVCNWFSSWHSSGLLDNSAAVNDGTYGFPIIHRFLQAELQTMKEVFPGMRFFPRIWKLLPLLRNQFPVVMYGEVFSLLHWKCSFIWWLIWCWLIASILTQQVLMFFHKLITFSSLRLYYSVPH